MLFFDYRVTSAKPAILTATDTGTTLASMAYGYDMAGNRTDHSRMTVLLQTEMEKSLRKGKEWAHYGARNENNET